MQVSSRMEGALFGLFVADAVAMPVHWMYNLDQLQADYGRITGYTKPKDTFVGSIMNLSNTGGGGRGSDKGDVVGSVILHGKKKYWVRGGNFHYHLGLQAGENTLEAQLARLLVRTLSTTKASSPAAEFQQAYIEFMTTPGSHNDTYASTCHRMFFANWAAGTPPADCPDNDGHNVDAIDLLTLTIPITLKYATASVDERYRHVREIIATTRRAPSMSKYAETYSDILVAVLHGQDLRTAISQHTAGDMASSIRRKDPMVACYMESSFPALLHFAYKYADSPEAAVLANANAGGENVARGAALGALLGAAHGKARFPQWARDGLYAKDAINAEIDAFLTTLNT
ncbi:hypothetical protein H310_07080 [Aphanomyces invadans]|uniref:ADP-ribosylglycohydrolase n=1 Tax=Aphanomyces invadans TaxID=157072 RepID=A0A024U2K4_9STRA|nr:hypothetical protein H310_07080 [Aphanomyces invadans]ETW00459.1 hypothetical protein H310_07080 [Aphanomyces invadans]|eukprot:XP_008870594.1 hypothetical protein H310_07080 [Aphanomyces invadans]